ncbi:MAG TPA: hypothetical protein VEJ20_01235 [Candidatus Eremiobacteraceae bacterium]|nr:hypothetical protein [Candidatus Eremiobacteraceae bacterium]
MDRALNRSLLAVATGGACIVASMTGACRALTAMPPVALFACGAAAVLARPFARRGLDAAAVRALIAGGAVALALPTSPPSATVIVDRALRTSGSGDLFALMDRIDDDPAAVLGARAAVTGSWTPAEGAAAATVSRRIMSCCAADAVDVGFDVETDQRRLPAAGTVVRVSGVLIARMVDGETRYALRHASIAWPGEAPDAVNARSIAARRTRATTRAVRPPRPLRDRGWSRSARPPR